MAEERTLVANLVPEIDTQALDSIINQLKEDLNFVATVTTSESSTTTDTSDSTATATDSIAEVNDTMAEMSAMMSAMAQSVSESTEGVSETMSSVTEGITESMDDVTDVIGTGDEDNKKLSESILEGVGNIAEIGIGALRSILDYVMAFWKRLEQASPLLRETMNLINNAINLILMPIGTAFALELIPLVTELYTFVGELTQTMWDAYEEGGITAMIATGISEGIPYLLEFFKEALMLIPDDIPVISDIRDFAVWALDWLEENADAIVDTLELLLDVFSVVADNIKTVVTLIGAFIGYYVAVKAMGLLSSIPGASLAAGIIGAGVGATVAYSSMSALGYAEGGHPITPQLALVAEDEPEYIIPDSKMPAFLEANATSRSGGDTYNLYFSGYNEDQLVRKVEEVTSRNAKLSSLRGGF